MTTPATYTRVLPGPTERRLASTLTQMDSDIATLYDGLRALQLGSSTLAGTLLIRDPDGQLTGLIGQQVDGTAGVTVLNASPPPRPNTATMTAFPAGVYVEWNGEFLGGAARPKNFQNVEVYLGASPTFVLGPSSFYGTLSEAGHLPVGPLDSHVLVYAVLLATNIAEDPANVGTGLRPTASDPSLVSAGVAPGQVVAEGVLDGIIDSTALADDAVSRAKIQADAVDGTKIADGSIQTPHMVAGSIDADVLAAATIYSGLIATDAIDARTIAALAVQADALAANSVQAGAIAAGAVTAAKLEADLLLASRIITGSLTGNRLELHPTNGLQGYYNGVRTMWWDNSTGSLFARGQWSTADAGERIVMNPGGTAPDQIRFYQTATDYGYISAEPGWDGGASVALRSTIVNGRIGGVYAYGSEAAMEWRIADSSSDNNPVTGKQMSAVSCVSGALNMWGGNVNLEARARLNTGQINFDYRDSNDNYTPSARLQYTRQGGVSPYLWGTQGNVGWNFNGNGEIFCYRQDTSLGGCYAAYWNSPSGQGSKKNVKNAGKFAGGRGARAGLRAVPVKSWNYLDERTPDDPAPAPLGRTVKVLRRDAHGRPVPDPATGDMVYDEVPLPDPEPLVHKPHFFPIAEDLQAVMPELVIENDKVPGGLGIDLRDVVGYLWQVCTEQDEELDALRTLVQGPGKGNAVQVDPGVPDNASFFERNGTLYYRNSVGQEKRVA